MRIVLATPLYPPEIAEPAPYVKELAARLSHDHQVTIIAYTHLPEAIPNVSIVTVEKGRPLFVRLTGYMQALVRAIRHADIVYAVNGTSVELPLGLVKIISRIPLFFCIADAAAHRRASTHPMHGLMERLVRIQAAQVITDLPLPRPEILPLEPYPTEAFATYEASWDAHLRNLTGLFI